MNPTTNPRLGKPRYDRAPRTPTKYWHQRRALGLTQRQMAARLGVSVRAVSAWESGFRQVRGAVAMLYSQQELPA